jgi:hypothetical protein
MQKLSQSALVERLHATSLFIYLVHKDKTLPATSLQGFVLTREGEEAASPNDSPITYGCSAGARRFFPPFPDQRPCHPESRQPPFHRVLICYFIGCRDEGSPRLKRLFHDPKDRVITNLGGFPGLKEKNRRFLIPIAMVTSMVQGQNKGSNPERVE